jgi:Family of unknown function (DUF5908)
MPVIIKELVIRATVTDSQGKEENTASSAPPLNNEEKESLVAACVQQVLEILEKKKDR